MASHPTVVWPLARVDVGTSDKCVDGGTSENRVDGESSDGCVDLGRMNTRLLNVVRHDVLPCWETHQELQRTSPAGSRSSPVCNNRNGKTKRSIEAVDVVQFHAFHAV